MKHQGRQKQHVKIGIGIDTGGTYTDAVMYDFDAKQILASMKALTTKDDLSVGIGNALDGLPSDLLRQAEVVALSTTLATNACVEDKGGRARLLFIGVDKRVVEWVGSDYGLPNADEIFFLDSKSNSQGTVVREPQWSSFPGATREWVKDACAVGVVDLDAMDNSAVLEKKARDLLRETYGTPVICGHELFSDLNSLKRGSSVLLNARLVPLIADFLNATRSALQKRDVGAPVVIVRSDGSVMSEQAAAHRPVETLLSGPAASAVGGLALAGEKDCLIVDMGGTTTDIAIARDGVPRRSVDGIQVGKWSTFVRGLFVDTFGLGGDSAVRFDDAGRMTLQPARLVPLSVAAQTWPVIVEKLKSLVGERRRHSLPLHEFFCLVKDISGSTRYTDREIAFCSALRNAPLIFAEAAEAAGADLYDFDVHRLEEEGIVLRCGLTPTDMMHLKGDFVRFNVEAARLGASFAASCLSTTPERLADMVYDGVKKKLYQNIVRVLLEERSPFYRRNDHDDRLETLISDSWEASRNGIQQHLLHFGFRTPAALVGIGAPIHIFLPDVARALSAPCIVPQQAGVANALGAILGNVTATCEVEIKPQYTVGGITGYIVFGKTRNTRVAGKQESIEIGIREAEAAAREEAVRRGAAGSVALTSRVVTSAAPASDGSDVLLGIKVIAAAIGRVAM